MRSALATQSLLATEYRTENLFCCAFRTSGERGVCLKQEERTTTDLSNTREHQFCHTVPFCSLPGAMHVNECPPLASQIVLSVEFFTNTSTSILTRWLLYKNSHNRTDFPERRHFMTHALTRFNPCDYFFWGEGFLKDEVFKLYSPCILYIGQTYR